MLKKIAVLTATRAEFSLLKPIIVKLKKEKCFDVKILVTGMHLSSEFGNTYQEIIDSGIKIDKKIEILLSSDSPSSISKSMGLATIGFAEYFSEEQFDGLIVLGDRYETLAVCIAAMNARIPIIHMYGGETTEGVIDEAIRHSITKMSHIHFVSNEIYKRRVIQLGENPHNVFNVGAIGIENVLNVPLMSKNDLASSINFNIDCDFAIITFHPVTLEYMSAKKQFSELLKALDSIMDMKYIFTKSNSDSNGRIINQMIDEYVNTNINSISFDSLGSIRYLSAIKFCSMVIGNSSSGLIEVPSFKKPTVNIGDRQKGRITPASVINCNPNSNEIIEAIHLARSNTFADSIRDLVNPYGDGDTSDKIVSILKDRLIDNKINIKKHFFDIDINFH